MTTMDISVLVNSNRPWEEVVRIVRALDEAGVHAVYVPDHFMPNTEDDSIVDGPRLEAWTMLTALSQLTSSCRLGALVLGGTYRHPAIVANMVASLDTVSGGRAIAGLGAGWQVNEHAAYGIDLMTPAELSDRFEESVAVVASMLRNDRTTFAGRYFQLADAPNNPRPVQERVPVLVGGGGERRTIPMAARYADVWHVWGKPDGYAAKSRKLDQACEAIGRDPAEVRRATGFDYPVGTDIAAALEPYHEVCDEFLVFDWWDRPMQSTLDDLAAALG
jgi:alkanesulfonate monooxygenase SsuD/methylene tetrahydromethanopterin reductase-like flavin-dependent oxidoreductase (luciferase family)